uniref:Uncharacterized protein n=1 Tax=Arundo donax TaxID=35708 RepID=A0A0A9CYR2_ARUDO
MHRAALCFEHPQGHNRGTFSRQIRVQQSPFENDKIHNELNALIRPTAMVL